MFPLGLRLEWIEFSFHNGYFAYFVSASIIIIIINTNAILTGQLLLFPFLQSKPSNIVQKESAEEKRII